MRAGMKPLAMSSAALVSAGLIAGAPATALNAPLSEHSKVQMSDAAVQLMANSIANIPLNLYRILRDIPTNQLDGLNAASESLEGSGNWWLYTPTNVLGWDQMDYAKAIGFTKMFTPIPEVAQAQADQINAIMARNFPMTRSCTGIPGPCADPYYFTAYFSTPLWQALFGYSYTFGDVFNAVDPTLEMPWSNQTLTYDPFGPGKALWDALTKDPEQDWQPPEAITWQERKEANDRFWNAVFNSFNPFVDGTYCLPCQIFVKGAPSSLPVVNIFGNVYTYFDFGQEFTDQDWSQPHPELPAAPSLKKLPLFSAEAWQRINADAKTYFNWVFKGGPKPEPEMEEPHNWPAIPGDSSAESTGTADTALLASNEVTAEDQAETKQVAETTPRKKTSLFTLDWGAKKDTEQTPAPATPTTPEDDGESTSQPPADTSTTPTTDETEPTDTNTTPTTDAAEQTDTAGSSGDSQQESKQTPRKRFADPFKPWGSSKQRGAESKGTVGEKGGDAADSTKSSASNDKPAGADKKSSESAKDAA